MKKVAILGAAALMIGGGAYFGSPYIAARDLKTSAISGDTDKLDAAVDFPSVRDSLKSQISSEMTKKMASDPSMKDNPFAGLGMLMVPAIVDKAVDAYVTPDGIAAMVRGEQPGASKSADHTDNPDIHYAYDWVNMDRFRVKMTNAKTHENGPALVFERRGIVTWKLVKIDLADSFRNN